MEGFFDNSVLRVLISNVGFGVCRSYGWIREKRELVVLRLIFWLIDFCLFILFVVGICILVLERYKGWGI